MREAMGSREALVREALVREAMGSDLYRLRIGQN